MLRWLAKRRGERGSILVFVGVGLPVLVAALALVLDVGDWFVQKRSLQNQVDAATLAGSDRWAACFTVGGQNIGPSGKSAGSAVMQQEATVYGGGTYNAQIGGDLKGQLQPLAFNQTVYPTAAPPSASADDTTPDPCFSYDAGNNKCDMSSPASGCRIQFDVKATENKLPLLFGGVLPSVIGPNLHATARSELREVAALQPSMPLAVPDVNPKFVTITFVNTATGAIVAGPCTGADRLGSTGCTFNVPGPPTATANGTKTWTESGANVTIGSGNQNKIGVRVGLGASANPCPVGSTGGFGYTCLDGFLPSDAPDPPITAVTVTPAFVSGAGTYTVKVVLEGNFQVYQPCNNGTSGANYSCPPNLATGSPGDPTLLLRFTSPTKTSSHTFAIECGQIPGNPGPNNNIYQEVRFGCLNSFSINDPDLCPDPTVPAPDPTDCAPIGAIGNGNETGPIQSAIEDRLVSGTCATNKYPDTSDPADPRIMILIVTDFAAFYGNGNGGASVPVVTYGAFYVTGWNRPNGNPPACNNEPAPAGATKGDIWGHFITYIGSGNPSGKTCKVGGLAPCVPALVK